MRNHRRVDLGRDEPYEYVRDNPVGYIDPDGRDWTKPWTWIKELKCLLKKEKCSRAVVKYCKWQDPYGAPPHWPWPGNTQYVNCVNEGTNKCCEVFYQKCGFRKF